MDRYLPPQLIKKLLLVDTDYFSKWIEAEAFASIKEKDITLFVWKNIVCLFGIPQFYITDNGPHFESKVYRNFCHQLKIKKLVLNPTVPSEQWLIREVSNKTLLTALKRLLHSAKGKWVDELPGVFWAYRTISRKLTGVSPFTLTYGMEAIIPTKIGMPTLRTEVLGMSNIEASPRT